MILTDDFDYGNSGDSDNDSDQDERPRKAKAAITVLLDRSGDYQKAKSYLQSLNVICRTAPKCPLPECGKTMSLIKYKCVDSEKYRCSKHKGKKLSIRHGSFVDNSVLPLPLLVKLSYFWAFKTTHKSTVEQTGTTK